MQAFRRLNKILIIPMIFLLPLWLVVGRTLFGVVGWGSVVYLFFGAPVIGVSLIVLCVLAHRPEVRSSKMFGMYDSLILSALYLAVFLQGFFMIDADDNKTVGSVSTKLFGNGFENASNTLFYFFYKASWVLLIAAFALLIYERVKKPLP